MWYLCVFFFFKQKTAYEMRISDWSSDVCSSDLLSQCRRVRSCVAACPSTTSSQQPPRSAAPAEPSASALLRMEGKRKARNHFPQFLPRGAMTDAQFPQLPLVEQCKAGREKFALDTALGQAGNTTEADSFRKYEPRFTHA